MARFTLPRDIYFGKDSIEELKSLTGFQKAFIVTGGTSMQKFGFLQRLEHILKEAGMQVQKFEGVEPDPSVETVLKGAEQMQEFQPDIIISIGGGSPIDAAKAMWVFYEHPETKFDDIKDPFTIPTLRNKAIFVAIPSTSGTATEVTAFSVITDYSNKVKYPLADYEITPDIAIVDPTLAETMPPKLVAHTGMDAMTHAIEAYVASGRSPFSDPLALEAISMVSEDLVDSYHGNKEARDRVHIAQCLAGMAFSNALLGITHSMAHKIGAQFNLSHGLCNAILLPYVIKFNSPACMRDFAAIAKRLGLPGSSDKQLTDSLIRHIQSLNYQVNIPACFKDCDVSEDTLKDNLDFIAHEAEKDPCTLSNPRKTSAEQIKTIIESAYYGTPLSI